MYGIGIGVKKANRNCFDARCLYVRYKALNLRWIKRCYYVAGSVHSFVDLETQVARHERCWHYIQGIVERGDAYAP